jgi:hypothetical protein
MTQPKVSQVRLIPGQEREILVAASRALLVLTKNSIVILALVNARSRTHKAPARQNPRFAPRSSSLFAVVTARPTVTHALQQLREYLSTMRENARVNNKRAGELPGFGARKVKPVWTTPPMIATRRGAERIVRGSAKAGSRWLWEPGEGGLIRPSGFPIRMSIGSCGKSAHFRNRHPPRPRTCTLS